MPRIDLDMFGIPFPRVRVDILAVDPIDNPTVAKCIFCERLYCLSAALKAKEVPIVCRFCEAEILEGKRAGIGMTMTPEGVRKNVTRGPEARRKTPKVKPRRKPF